MSRLVRYYTQSDTYFVTTVTRNRSPILVRYFPHFQLAIMRAHRKFTFDEIAWVVLPDHYHAIIQTPKQQLSEIMHAIKASFSAIVREDFLVSSGSLWQPRFWDHFIRNQTDFNHHFDYIHFNPVKHDMVMDPAKYKYSSFDKYLRDGTYQKGWGAVEKPSFCGEYSE